MPMVVGVIVRRIKDKVYAQTGKYTVNLNDKVILETEHGTEFGVVCEKERNMQPLTTLKGVITEDVSKNITKIFL